jgi:hypothetical protein
MNNGDCKTCRKQKYCSSTCTDAKKRLAKDISEAFAKTAAGKVLEIITRGSEFK